MYVTCYSMLKDLLKKGFLGYALVAISAMCLKVEFLIISNSFEVPFLMKSWTDNLLAEFLIVSFETYHGLSVIIRSVVRCLLY